MMMFLSEARSGDPDRGRDVRDKNANMHILSPLYCIFPALQCVLFMLFFHSFIRMTQRERIITSLNQQAVTKCYWKSAKGLK